ncbi:hypothetical protein [Sutterella wadsworthensis]|jgi:hypothetical protein|uniref:hypothetical protein n=1 Tax=Sutterella wadsworthensis TaxID=40545 RepID=UPI003A92859A
MNTKKINVGLYGDGSRGARLRAEYIACDRAEECSLYKSGKCFNVTTLFGLRCPIGTMWSVDGGMKQSKAFRNMQVQVRADPLYAKLKYPYHEQIGRIGDDAFLGVLHIRIEDQNGRLNVSDPGFGNNRVVVKRDTLTPENLNRICAYQPRAFMGGVITSYQEETVPNFLHQLSLLFPDEYAALIAEYPEYAEKKPNFIGRIAKLATCNPACEYKDGGSVFRFDGDWLICDCYKSSFAPFGGKGAMLKIQLTDEMTVKITDNAQVLPETVLL